MEQSIDKDPPDVIGSVELAYEPHEPEGFDASALERPLLFHLAGTPVRAATAEKAVFVGPKAKHPAMWMLDGREWAVAGVYMLLAERQSASRGVYVGSTKDLVERINQHQHGVTRAEAEDFQWSQAVLLTATGLTRGEAYQLERALGDAIVASLVDVLTQGWINLPEYQPRDTPWAVRDAVIVLAERCLIRLGIDARLPTSD